MLWVEGALARAPSSANLSSAHLSSARSLLKIVERSSFKARVGVRVFRVEKKGACAKILKIKFDSPFPASSSSSPGSPSSLEANPFWKQCQTLVCECFVCCKMFLFE